MITAKTKVKTAIENYPEVKEHLINISPKFKKLNNPMVFKTVARWATINDISRIGHIPICELLHKLNKIIGTEEELLKSFPECIKDKIDIEEENGSWMDDIDRFSTLDVRNRDDFFMPEILKMLSGMRDKEGLKIINSFDPIPLKKMVKERNGKYFTEKINPYQFNLYLSSISGEDELSENEDEVISEKSWKERKDEFEVLDVRGMREDPFSLIMKRAYEAKQGEGFSLVQSFRPDPLINMLEPMGFEHLTEQIGPIRYKIYFFKKESVKDKKSVSESGKIPLVIQSATPIAYPVIMRMLQSERLMSKIEIEELKVWSETEKHLGWIVSGRADISFSAVFAASKLYANGTDIKFLSVDIWDNFFILTRGYKADSFEDLKGHTIHMPLFKGAPPFAITKFLMRKTGFNENDFDFAFGEPFGRPEVIKEKFISGEYDTVMLREPEASFALYGAGKDAHVSLSYIDIWNEINPDAGRLPNAGVVVKSSIVEKYPELVKIFGEELDKAIKWVKSHPQESANLSYDIMREDPKAVELFIRRAGFEHVTGENAKKDIRNYLDVLVKDKVLALKKGASVDDVLTMFDI